jgi:hypothetical protein
MKRILIHFMKRIAMLVLAAALGLAGCKEEVKNTCRVNGPQDLPWLQRMIDADSTSRERGEVVRYSYKGETVILVDQCQNCPDGAVVVYNCRGEEICIFGTIAGRNTCPDFFSVAVREEVLWSR